MLEATPHKSIALHTNRNTALFDLNRTRKTFEGSFVLVITTQDTDEIADEALINIAFTAPRDLLADDAVKHVTTDIKTAYNSDGTACDAFDEVEQALVNTAIVELLKDYPALPFVITISQSDAETPRINKRFFVEHRDN